MLKNKIIPNSPIAIIYDTPSVEDVPKSRHLQSRAGQALIKYLSNANIIFNECSILTVVPERHTRLKYIHRQELVCWKEVLRRDLELAKPNLIITIGEFTFHQLTEFLGHEKYRGSVLQCPDQWSATKILPLFDFSYYFSHAYWHPLTEWDCQKAYQHSKTKDFLRNGAEIIVTKDMELLESIFLDPEYVNNPDSLLAFDIEASGSDLTAISFAKDTTQGYVIPLVHMTTRTFAQCLVTIDNILRNPVRKIAQNGQFDIFYLAYYYGVKVENYWWDTMLAMHAAFSNIPKGLDTLASIFTNEPYWKDEGKQWKLPYNKINWPQFFEYSGKDSVNTLEVAINQKPLLEARGTMHIFRQEMDLVYPVVAIEYKGFNINADVKTTLIEDNADEIMRWDLFLHTLVEFPLNINSPKQLKEYLFDIVKLPNRVRKGKLTTDEDALLSLIPYSPVLIKTIMILRDIKKQKSFYNIKIDSDNRVRTTLKPAGTETGRLASSKSIVGTGFNLQTIPKEIRQFFIPDDDYILVQADYSKAESWVVAYLAEDEKMIAALHGPDFHSTNASNILGKEVSKKDYSDRQLGKRIGHACSYGMTAFLLQKVLLKDGYNYSKKECQEFINMFFRAYPKILTHYHKAIERQLSKDRTLVNIFGRKITYWDFWNQQLFNKAYAYIPQGTIGDMTNRALINVYNWLPKYNGDLLLQVHDSLVMQIPKVELTQQFVDELKVAMTIPLTIKGYTISIPIDVECGYDWYNLTEWADFKEAI